MINLTLAEVASQCLPSIQTQVEKLILEDDQRMYPCDNPAIWLYQDIDEILDEIGTQQDFMMPSSLDEIGPQQDFMMPSSLDIQVQDHVLHGTSFKISSYVVNGTPFKMPKHMYKATWQRLIEAQVCLCIMHHVHAYPLMSVLMLRSRKTHTST